MAQRPGFFVPNQGQWDHPAHFVHESGAMTLFLQDRGWMIDILESPKDHAKLDDSSEARTTRGVAVGMTFEGETTPADLVGEDKQGGRLSYFLGSDQSKWRSDVPIYSAVRYQSLYEGIDLRLREMQGVPEYDLLLQPGADLDSVVVRVDGAKSLTLEKDGTLTIETEFGPLTQTAPKTWEEDTNGRSTEVDCHFRLLDNQRFGFVAPDWRGDKSLTIDPGLVWTVYGGNAYPVAAARNVDGVLTLAGYTMSSSFPTTAGAYSRTFNSGTNAVDGMICCYNPNKPVSSQFLYGVFIGGNGQDYLAALAVDPGGVITVAGRTNSTNYPTMSTAFDRKIDTTKGGIDACITCVDPRKFGSAQLLFSTYLGGDGATDAATTVSFNPATGITVAGNTNSNKFPTTWGAYDRSFNGKQDGFVTRLSPSKIGSAQLIFSTYYGGKGTDSLNAMHVDSTGKTATVVGATDSTDFPTSKNAYDTSHNKLNDVFAGTLLVSAAGAAGLTFSTYVGGSSAESAHGVFVDDNGVVTVTGAVQSTNYPTTIGAYDATFGGGTGSDAFVTCLGPWKTGSGQLLFSTYLGGAKADVGMAVRMDSGGFLTVSGSTKSSKFPITADAYRKTVLTDDAFATRLNPGALGSGQLMHSTFLGEGGPDFGVFIDHAGTANVSGRNSGGKLFISRLDTGVLFFTDVYEVALTSGGTQTLHVNAGKQHAGKTYWIVGSYTGTKPGVTISTTKVPLNLDLYTDLTIANRNTAIWKNTFGKLDATGSATATFNVPATKNLPSFDLHHAYVVFDSSGNPVMASQAVPLHLK